RTLSSNSQIYHYLYQKFLIYIRLPARLPGMNQLQNPPASFPDDSLDHEGRHDQLASLLKAAGDPLRLDILRVVAQDSFGVLELCRSFALKQSAMGDPL